MRLPRFPVRRATAMQLVMSDFAGQGRQGEQVSGLEKSVEPSVPAVHQLRSSIGENGGINRMTSDYSHTPVTYATAFQPAGGH